MREGIEKLINSKSKTFLAFCFCFILGTALASYLRFSNWYIFVFLIFSLVAVIFVIYFRKNVYLRFVFLALVFFIFGILRTHLSYIDCDEGMLCEKNGQTLSFVGKVSDEPNRKVEYVEYKVDAINFNNGEGLSGRALVRSRLYPGFHYGDMLKIKCKLKDPKEMDTGDFRYDMYLARYGVGSVCSFPNIELLESGGGNYFLRKIYEIKSAMNDKLGKVLPEPEASLAAGILYGAKSGISKNLSDAFSISGVSHIVAVSGFNITILITVLSGLMPYLGLYRRQSFWLIISLIILFTIFSGISASAVRAAIMGMVVLSGKQLGRGSSVLNILVFTAALMQLSNPFLLMWDVGFQLSFLATLGLIYLTPVLDKYFCKLPGLVREPFSTTMAAIVATLPLIMFQFGRVSLVAPVVNVLILWAVPLIMLITFILLAVSFIVAPLTLVFSSLAHFGLSYVIIIVEFFAKLPFSSLNITIGPVTMLVLYTIIVAIYLKYEKSKSL